jgi:sugar phosphate isomerase/epimerase
MIDIILNPDTDENENNIQDEKYSNITFKEAVKLINDKEVTEVYINGYDGIDFFCLDKRIKTKKGWINALKRNLKKYDFEVYIYNKEKVKGGFIKCYK